MINYGMKTLNSINKNHLKKLKEKMLLEQKLHLLMMEFN